MGSRARSGTRSGPRRTLVRVSDPTPAPAPTAKEPQTWERVQSLVRALLPALREQRFDAILAITRGGMVPGCLLSQALGQRNVLTAAVMFYTDGPATLEEPVFLQFPSDALLYGKRVLVADDVWDSGKTAVAVRDRIRRAGGHPVVAVLHFKPGRNRFPGDGPDAYGAVTDAWIVYPWDPARGWADG